MDLNRISPAWMVTIGDYPHFFMESESIPDWLEQLKSEREKAKFTKDKTVHR